MTEPAGIERPLAVETCRNGHPWTEENTLRRISSGKPIRQCRTCARAAAKARADRRTAGPEPAAESEPAL